MEEEDAEASIRRNLPNPFAGIPCIKQAILVGLGTGILMGLHRYRVGTVVNRCIDVGFFVGMGGGYVNFYLCDFERRMKAKEIKEILDQQGAIHVKTNEELRKIGHRSED